MWILQKCHYKKLWCHCKIIINLQGLTRQTDRLKTLSYKLTCRHSFSSSHFPNHIVVASVLTVFRRQKVILYWCVSNYFADAINLLKYWLIFFKKHKPESKKCRVKGVGQVPNDINSWALILMNPSKSWTKNLQASL